MGNVSGKEIAPADAAAALLEPHHRKKRREKEEPLVFDPSETVDGGYFVTQGIYAAAKQDFKPKIVRQLMIDRKIAPFYKGLSDYDEYWTDRQLLAAIRDLPVPAADSELQTQTQPAAPAICHSPARSHSHSASSFESALCTTSPATSICSTAQHKQRTASNASSSSSLLEFPKIQPSSLPKRSPHDPLQPLSALDEAQLRSRAHTAPAPADLAGAEREVLLYRNAVECPICFLYYPPYLNMTRCCAQMICTECFVQIKRAAPHPPHEHDEPAGGASTAALPLVSEPATCPFCQEPHFGVTYAPSPFRSGTGANNCTRPVDTLRRSRAQSVSHDAPGVVTTDDIRPDWNAKLSTALASIARRSAAATALHSSSFMLPSPNAIGASSPGSAKKEKKKSRLRGFSTPARRKEKDKDSSASSSHTRSYSSTASSSARDSATDLSASDKEVVSMLEHLRVSQPVCARK